jgi:hypothetical protein
MMQTNAARFDTFACAKEFAKANHITFNGHTYIGIEDFPLFDEQPWASLDHVKKTIDRGNWRGMFTALTTVSTCMV